MQMANHRLLADLIETHSLVLRQELISPRCQSHDMPACRGGHLQAHCSDTLFPESLSRKELTASSFHMQIRHYVQLLAQADAAGRQAGQLMGFARVRGVLPLPQARGGPQQPRLQLLVQRPYKRRLQRALYDLRAHTPQGEHRVKGTGV